MSLPAVASAMFVCSRAQCPPSQRRLSIVTNNADISIADRSRPEGSGGISRDHAETNSAGNAVPIATRDREFRASTGMVKGPAIRQRPDQSYRLAGCARLEKRCTTDNRMIALRYRERVRLLSRRPSMGPPIGGRGRFHWNDSFAWTFFRRAGGAPGGATCDSTRNNVRLAPQ